MLREATNTITTNLDITGALTANNILTSSQIAAQYQPTLQSTAQDNRTTGIFSLFGTGAASDKLRYITAAAGCVAPASFEGVSINNAPLTGFAAVKGYDQATSMSTG